MTGEIKDKIYFKLNAQLEDRDRGHWENAY